MTSSKHIWIAKLILIIYLPACFIIGCKKSSQDEPAVNKQVAADEAEDSSPVSNAIEKIINNRTSWNPIFVNFYKKQMPDLRVTDIKGKVHNLKDYRGKNVVVTFWATWCQPCMMEVPHLKALREIMPADKLAILAISNESPYTVKKIAESKGLTYTVISEQGALPAPFGSTRSIPTTFFIRPDGKLKLVVEGASHLGEMKAIILAD